MREKIVVVLCRILLFNCSINSCTATNILLITLDSDSLKDDNKSQTISVLGIYFEHLIEDGMHVFI